MAQAQSAELSGVSIAAVTPAAPSVTAHPAVEAGEALLRYVLNLPITVRGDRSGRDYQFSGQAAIQSVDLRDADEFLRSRLFRRLA